MRVCDTAGDLSDRPTRRQPSPPWVLTPLRPDPFFLLAKKAATPELGAGAALDQALSGQVSFLEAGNALAAALAARRYGVRMKALSGGMESFRALPHRLEPVGEIGGVRFFNDSKATNVASARAALSGFDSGVVLIAGGTYKEIPFLPLREELARCGSAAVLIGESRPRLLEDLAGTVPLRSSLSRRTTTKPSIFGAWVAW